MPYKKLFNSMPGIFSRPGYWLLLSALLFTSPAFAAGEKIIEAIMRSDFIFDKNISNVPFLPLGYLQLKHNPEIEFEDNCLDVDACEFSYSSLSQGFGLPVWVGQQDMLILGETLESDKLEFANQTITINSWGVLAAWLSQPTPLWQVGAFAYVYEGFDQDASVDQDGGIIFGGGGRYRHQSTFHSYWGLVGLDEGNDPVYYPYVGFDWFIGKTISISALVPWPTISYSPDPDSIYKFGASVSGSDLVTEAGGKVSQNSLGIVDFGLAYEKRLSGMLWLETGAGYSGFARALITTDSDIEFESNLEPSPYVRFSLNLRPE